MWHYDCFVAKAHEVVDSDGCTPLLLACKSGLDDVAMAMLDLCPAVGSPDNCSEVGMHKQPQEVKLGMRGCESARDAVQRPQIRCSGRPRSVGQSKW